MRNAILAMILASTLVTGELPAATPKPNVGPGRIAWFDISTTDLPRSKDFYGKLFDWQFTPIQGTDQEAEIVAGGTAIGTLRVAEGKISAGQAPEVAADSYLEIGDLIGDLALVYDWCFPQTTAAQRTRWLAYADQAVWNVWNHTTA